ncbi:hypothetical protein HDU96_004475 [Phlyctochytrium bullatum]|nr:hypothetical protein HDU96_004475 [Phlyctochytrium bullatum]
MLVRHTTPSLLLAALLLLLLAPIAPAHPLALPQPQSAPGTPAPRTCGTPSTPSTAAESAISTRMELLMRQLAAANQSLSSDSPRTPNPFRVLKSGREKVVDVWVHVVTDATGEGNVSDARVAKQVEVLNGDWGGTYAFRLAGVTRTVNPDWFANAGPLTQNPQLPMKTALRKGDASTLNVYTVNFTISPGLLGYSTFPWEYPAAPLDDGVVIHHATLPDGPVPPYNLGRTLSHEAGHWFGLLHTFQGGCSFPNDFVTDTPPEAFAAIGCPAVGRKTCQGQQGVDAVRNIMNYVDDECMLGFSPGQVLRFEAQMQLYRGF